MNNVQMESRSTSSGFAPYPAAASACWEALVADTDSAVLVVDQDGVIQFANKAASASLTGNGHSPAGRRFNEFVSAEFADERLALVRRAVESGKPVTLVGMFKGTWQRTSMRPLPADDKGRVHVLVVTTAGGPPGTKALNASTTEPVVRAKIDDLGVLGTLTNREMEILKLIGEGLSTADIARRLHRSVKTIEWHRVSLGSKLGVTNRVELARIALRAGLTDLNEASSEQPAAAQS